MMNVSEGGIEYAVLIGDTKRPIGTSHPDSVALLERHPDHVYVKAGDARVFTKNIEWARSEGLNVARMLKPTEFILDLDNGTRKQQFLDYASASLGIPGLTLPDSHTVMTRGGSQIMFTFYKSFPKTVLTWVEGGKECVAEILADQTTAVVGNTLGGFQYRFAKSKSGHILSNIADACMWIDALINKTRGLKSTCYTGEGGVLQSPYPQPPVTDLAHALAKVDSLFNTAGGRNNFVFSATRALIMVGWGEDSILVLLENRLANSISQDFTISELRRTVKSAFMYCRDIPPQDSCFEMDGKQVLTTPKKKPLFGQFMPKGKHMIASKTGVGKTQFGVFLCLCAAVGKNPITPSGSEGGMISLKAPLKSIILSEEDPVDSKFLFTHFVNVFGDYVEGGMEECQRLLQANIRVMKGAGSLSRASLGNTVRRAQEFDADIVLCDGISYMTDQDHSSSEGATFLNTAFDSLSSKGACVIVVNHLIKQRDDVDLRSVSQDSISGSFKLHGYMNLIYILASEIMPDGGFCVSARCTKSRRGTMYHLHIEQKLETVEGVEILGVTGVKEIPQI